jgi:hypothetical protein
VKGGDQYEGRHMAEVMWDMVSDIREQFIAVNGYKATALVLDRDTMNKTLLPFGSVDQLQIDPEFNVPVSEGEIFGMRIYVHPKWGPGNVCATVHEQLAGVLEEDENE